MEYSPSREFPKALRGYSELTTSTGMWPNGLLMETPNHHIEQGIRLASEPLSGTQLLRIKIDVGVKVSEFVHPAKIVSFVARSRAATTSAIPRNWVVQIAPEQTAGLGCVRQPLKAALSAVPRKNDGRLQLIRQHGAG